MLHGVLFHAMNEEVQENAPRQQRLGRGSQGFCLLRSFTGTGSCRLCLTRPTHFCQMTLPNCVNPLYQSLWSFPLYFVWLTCPSNLGYDGSFFPLSEGGLWLWLNCKPLVRTTPPVNASCIGWLLSPFYLGGFQLMPRYVPE